MSWPDTSKRSKSPEIMDDFTLKGDALRKTLDKIAAINSLLGGNRVSFDGLKKLIQLRPDLKTLKIIDAGCGNGEMLRELRNAKFLKSFNLELIGIDANPDTIAYARQSSVDFQDIRYKCADILHCDSAILKCDVILCTLTLHHFSNPEIELLLQRFYQNAAIGIVINDLHRSIIAYKLFQLVCKVFSLEKMAENDGLISILRGFKRQELRNFSNKLNLKKYHIHWKWAFRYQWIISKL